MVDPIACWEWQLLNVHGLGLVLVHLGNPGEALELVDTINVLSTAAG